MAPSSWTIAAASVRGRGHEQTGAPCQDSSAVLLSPNGKWVALAASDGAGTAKFAETGSRLVADEIAKCLIRLSEECDRRAPGAWVSDRIIRDIVAVRDRLRDLAGSDNISDYHCTLSAALVGPTGGFTVHLGDGAIFGGSADGQQGDVLDLAKDYFVSAPQNGEYANETVFLTERDWIKHLRIQPVTAVDWVMLGTDGGMALAMVGETKPKSGFVVPVIRALIQESDFPKRCRALEAILDDRQADRLTNDDKTLIAAIRPQYRHVIGEFGSSAKQDAGVSSQPAVVPPTVGTPQLEASSLDQRLTASSDGQRDAKAGRATVLRSLSYTGWGWLNWLVAVLGVLAIAVVAWTAKNIVQGLMSPEKRALPSVAAPTPRSSSGPVAAEKVPDASLTGPASSAGPDASNLPKRGGLAQPEASASVPPTTETLPMRGPQQSKSGR